MIILYFCCSNGNPNNDYSIIRIIIIIIILDFLETVKYLITVRLLCWITI